MTSPFDTLAEALADRYTIVRELGSGGMATVYLANDLRHDRQVALKVLKPEVAVVLGAERFLREIKTTAQLSHPHILPLFDSGSAGELLYYVMPYVEGETLGDRVDREGRVAEKETLQFAAEILGALDYAHGQGVIHRDIKPSNILISTTGHALLADFGIARAISAAGADAVTRPGAVIGTPAYMPPEQARGEPVSPATDVYATGLVLYECLCGNRFPEASLYHAADWSALPARFRGPLQRALQPKPADRWSNAAALRHALLRGPGRWQRVLSLGAAGATLVALVAVLFTLTSRPATVTTAETRLAVFPFTVRGDPALEYLGDGMVDLLSTKLDGAGSWRTADPRAVLSLVRREAGDATVDPTAGHRMAERLDAALFVLGNVIAVGSEVRLDAALYRAEPSPEVVAQASAEGDGENVLALLDAMAAELLSRSGAGGDARLTQIASVTSQSLPALKSYLRGIRALRAGEFAPAADAFEGAIAEDSAFALAWYQLSIAADWLLRANLALEAADQAVRYGARLPDRDRRLLEALRTIRTGNAEASEQQLWAILGRHPDDIEAWSQLAELQFHFGPPRRRPVSASRDAWRRLLELEPEWGAAYVHLARIAAGERDLEALDSLSQRALALAPEGDRGLEMRTLRLMLNDDAAARERVRRSLQDAPDDLLGEVNWSVGTFVRDRDIRMMVLDAATAERQSRDLRVASFGHLASTEAVYGRREAARVAVDSVMVRDSVRGLIRGAYLALVPALQGDLEPLLAYRERLAGADWRQVPPSTNRAVWFTAHEGVHEYIRWYLLAMTDALRGDSAAAMTLADSLSRATPPPVSGSLVPDFAETIRAAVAWYAGRPEEALAALSRIQGRIWHQLAAESGFYSQGLPRYLRALVLEELGRAQEALGWYATLTETSPEDRVFEALARLGRARISESLLDRDAARTQYRAVLALWDQADPELQPVVEDARERLRRLEGPAGGQ